MLPIMAKPEDALAVVGYLKTKATGATLGDAKATLPPNVLDSRKVAAYKAWGLIIQDSDRIRLTSRGRQLARASEEERGQVFGEVVLEIHAYQIGAEWIHHRDLEVVPLSDLAAHWFDHVQSDLGTTNERTIRNQAACFLGLAQAAELGKYVIGRRGQPTRLEVNREALSRLVAGLGHSPGDVEQEEADIEGEVDPKALGTDSQAPSEPTSESKGPVSGPLQEAASTVAGSPAMGVPPQSAAHSESLGMPEVRLNLEIRIDASVTPEQIDQIFASMAKHLYQRDDEGR